jgi:predicted esterase
MKKINTLIETELLQDKPLILFFHGLFGTTIGSCADGQIKNSFEYFKSNKLASVAMYQTSRHTERSKDVEFIEWAKESFEGKSFNDELSDVARALEQILQSAKYTRLLFVGFSLGGTLSTFFLEKYKPDGVLMFGSSCMTNSHNVPIGSTYPKKEIILKNLENYPGILKIYQGTDDTVVPKEGALEMIKMAKNSSRRDFVILHKVDHRFLFRNNIRDTSLDQDIFKEIELLL